MEGKFIINTSDQFIKLKGNLNKSLNDASLNYQEVIKQKVLDKVKDEGTNQVLDKLKDICSSNYDELNSKLTSLKRKLEAMSIIMQNSLSQLDGLQNYVNVLNGSILVFGTLVELLKLLPIPTMFSTIGVTNKMSDVLNKITNKLAGFELIVLGISMVISSARFFLYPISLEISKLSTDIQLLSDQLKNCDDERRKKLGEDLEKTNSDLNNNHNKLISSFNLRGDDLNNITSKGILNGKNSYDTYKGYTFQIVEEEVTDKSIQLKRRHAVAINKNGGLNLEGTPSYANDEKVLIDELKFIIDKDDTVNNPSIKNTLYDEHDKALVLINSTKTKTQEQMLNSLNEDDTKFIKSLEDAVIKWGSRKAKKLIRLIDKKEITIYDAKEQWRSYLSKWYWYLVNFREPEILENP